MTSFKWVRKFYWLFKIDNNHIDNSKKCVDNINKEFNICSTKNNGKSELSDSENPDENIEINDENFMEVVEKSLSFIKDNYINQSNSENENPINNENIKKSKETEKKKKKKKYTKRFKILKHCLNQLKYNGLSIDEFMKKSPFQIRPYQLPYSLDFIKAVKFDKFDKLEELLEFPELLYSYDYYRQTGFHWAVKMNKIKALIMMLKCGNCINQTDINGFTPLAIAAKNNNVEICQILCDSGANPLIPNNDGLLPVDLAKDIKLKSYLNVFTYNYSHKWKKEIF